MSPVRNRLAASDHTATADALQGTLVDLLDLSLLAKQAHWNLYGPQFRSLHLQVDEVVTIVRAQADEVAERASTIGVSPDGQAATIASSSGLPSFPPGRIKDTEAATTLMSAMSTMINRLHDRAEATGSTDPVTQDLLIGITGTLEKQYWMLRAGTDH
ncbi:DNA starvation/stationary phase protection protein [Streptomyces sp. NPDC050400]|uniref:DNA starvation/stationary phase protection protein n=1 Tax=Streptomyces sp. NPDC050400 TaxID=3365610 RepID=UPI00379467E2